MILTQKYPLIQYESLPAKYQEAYNFQKAASILADHGFITNLLQYDWEGADFIAMHINGDYLKVQLKARIHTSPIYVGKDIYIMFEEKLRKNWYFYPHDELWNYTLKKYDSSTTYAREGLNHGSLTQWMLEWLDPYILSR